MGLTTPFCAAVLGNLSPMLSLGSALGDVAGVSFLSSKIWTGVSGVTLCVLGVFRPPQPRGQGEEGDEIKGREGGGIRRGFKKNSTGTRAVF